MSICFRLGGCPVEARFSFFALLAFCCLFLGAGNSVFFLAAAACHESAHVAALFYWKAPPAKLLLSGLGCRLTLDPQRPLSYSKMAWVSLAGPGANLLIAVGLLLLGQGETPFFAANFALGVFHCLPVEPLDGGMALRAFLSCLLGSDTAAKITFAVGLAVLIPLAVLGFVILLRTRYNFSLLAISLYLMLYLVLKHDLFTG